MFRKRKIVTSLIALLFFSRQISFAAAGFGSCPENVSSVSTSCATGLTDCSIICSSGEKLYAIDDADSTSKASELTGGYYLFSNAGALLGTGTGTALYYADSTRATSKTIADGFYINTDQSGTYIKCTGNSCTVVSNPNSDTCTADTASGQLTYKDTKVQLCLSSGKNAEFSSTTKNYLVNYSANSVFSSVTADHYGIVSVTANSMTIDTASTDAEICASDSALEVSALSDATCTSATQYSSCASGICQKYCKVGTGANCLANTYYLVDAQATSVPVTGTAIGKLFYCTTVNQACTEKTAIGYYVNDNTNAFSCTADGCKIETIAANAACTSQTIGKLAVNTDTGNTSNTAFCLNYSTSAIAKKLTTETGIYLLNFANNNIFGITTGKKGLVKIEEHSVTLISGTTPTGTGYVVEGSTTSNILAAVDTKGTLYSCTSGLCSAVPETNLKIGYFINAGDDATTPALPYISCSYGTDSAVECKPIANPSSVTCNSSKAGTFGTDAKLCLDDEKTLEATFIATETKYLVGYGSENSIFASTIGTSGKYGIIVANATAIVLETTYNNDYGVCADTSLAIKTLLTSSTSCSGSDVEYGFCSGGVCFKPCNPTDTSNCDDEKYYLVKSKNSKIPILSPSTEGYLYYCPASASACEERKTKGYYMNDKDNVFSCNGTEGKCVIETIASGAECTAQTIGKLALSGTDPAICLNFKTDGITELLSATETVLMTYASGNLFGITEGNMGLITIKENSATLSDATGYCAEDGTTSNTLGTSGSTAVTLYNCTAGLCGAVSSNDIKIGYYRNSGSTTQGTSDYIKCSLSGETKICKIVDVTAANACSTAGDLIYDTSYKICVTAAIPVALDPTAGTTDGSYFMDASATSNTNFIFGTTKANRYSLVDIDKDKVFLHPKETGIERYRYGDKDTLKLLDFKESSVNTGYCENKALISTKTPKEFLLADDDTDTTSNYYEEVAAVS